MAARTQEQIEAILKTLSPSSDLIYDVLFAYGLPKATVTRVKSGDLNRSKEAGQILWRNKLCYKETLPGTALTTLQEMQSCQTISKQRPRFIIASDGETWYALDTKYEENREIPIKELHKHCDFFLPWTGREKAKFYEEKPADINAAQKMGKLFDAIKADNPNFDEHALNVFMARLLFCFFAEDSGILPEDQMFTDLLEEATLEDGSDLADVLSRIFRIMNLPETAAERADLPIRYSVFPYVNGGLFAHDVPVPEFSRKSRNAVLTAGRQDWSEINTDIFGNMFQACQDPEKREELGEHYTSVPNIMKVISPLFLDELREEAEKVKGNQKAAERFINRISTIRFFDPACGSGNFLLVAFKELRELEMEVIEATPGLLRLPQVNISQFYGIEIDDFAHEVAVLSMWLVDHQMNQRFHEIFSTVVPTLPLRPNNNIILGNALRTEWESVCPKALHTHGHLYSEDPVFGSAESEEQAEIYVFGNPPYGGYTKQTDEQKEDMTHVFRNCQNYSSLDYVSAWFYLGARYIQNSDIKCAFVATNSITQGEQVYRLWNPIFNTGAQIAFAYTSFKWTNNAKKNAGVTCVIICLTCDGRIDNERTLFDKDIVLNVRNITPYLTTGETIYIIPRSRVLSSLPAMNKGNSPVDGGSLILDLEEKENLVNQDNVITEYIRDFIGSEEFIHSKKRYCLWMPNLSTEDAYRFESIRARLQKCEKMRQGSKKQATKKLALVPHKMGEIRHKDTTAILVPRHSSERRMYVPMGYVDEETIISDSALAIYDADPWVFALISSEMHMAWVRAACGRLETRIRYAAKLCYNTFPIRKLSKTEIELLTESAYNILDIREKHCEMTLGDMYYPENMPADLRQAHEANDRLVDSLYRKKPFFSEEERLECLLALYQQMIG